MAVLQLADVVRASNGIVLTKLLDGSRDAYVRVDALVEAFGARPALQRELSAALEQIVVAARQEVATSEPIYVGCRPR